MKKVLLSFLLLGICNLGLYADEFVINKFNFDSSDLTGRTEAKTDVNDEFCAIIKVRTDIPDIKFFSNQLEDVIEKDNEYWLYVSPGIKHIEFSKSGFIKQSYVIPKKIESLNVYVLELTNKDQTRLTIISKPAEAVGADILINGEKQQFQTPYLFKVKPGKYYVTVQHPDFIDMTKEVTLKELEKKDLIFNLRLYEGSDLQKYHYSKKYKRIGWISSAALISAGFAFNYLADEAYEKSNSTTSTSVADDNWKKYELYQNMRNVTYSVSVLPLFYGTYNWFREIRLHKIIK